MTTVSMNELHARAVHVGEVAWNRFFHTGTSLLYDYVSDYDPDHRFDHLPTVDEIGRQEPNTNGWGTGMEDSAINGGVLLAALCDRYAATEDTSLHNAAAGLLNGLELCGTQSGVEGFVLRSVSPWDRKSFFIETSRDQLTHFAHGIWRYARSPLSTKDECLRMRRLIALLCHRLEKKIVAENGFCFCKVNGDRGLVDKMWEVSPHEAPRLPMIYAVGWELTGDDHWHTLYRRYVRHALKQAQTLKVSNYDWCYALFQHQVSMEVLHAIEKEDPILQRGWREEMERIAAGITPYLTKMEQYVAADVRDVNMDWRTRPSRNVVSGYGPVPIWPQAMLQEFRPIREVGEALLIKLVCPDGNLSEEELSWLTLGLNKIDCDKAFTYAMHYPPAAYWRLAANQTGKQTVSKPKEL